MTKSHCCFCKGPLTHKEKLKPVMVNGKAHGFTRFTCETPGCDRGGEVKKDQLSYDFFGYFGGVYPI